MRLALHHQILIGLGVGLAAGLTANALYGPGTEQHERLEWTVRNLVEPVGQVFLRIIFMVVIPLVFCALYLGVAGLGDVRRLGGIGARTLAYTLVFSGLSVAIAVFLANALQPGRTLSDEKRAMLQERYAPDAETSMDQARRAKTPRDALLDIIPRNPLQEAVGALDGSAPGGGMLAVMFFALVLGVATTAIDPAKAAPLLRVLEAAYEVVMVVIAFAMRLAPLGVAALVFSLAALLGLDILRTLAGYVAIVLAGLALHCFIVYPLALLLLARTSPLRFFAGASEALVTAFATSSSNATLPTTLRVAEENLKLPREVSRFVLTIGATANQNGTALFEGVTVLFLAQVFGIDLTTTQQVTVALMCVLAGVGTAGVPGGSIPLVILVLQAVHVPPDAIGIILGVDRLLDMCRTTVNVAGDIAIASCVSRSAAGAPPRPATAE